MDIAEHETEEYLINAVKAGLGKEEQYKVNAGLNFAKLRYLVAKRIFGHAPNKHVSPDKREEFENEMDDVCYEHFNRSKKTMQNYLTFANADDPVAYINEVRKEAKERMSRNNPEFGKIYKDEAEEVQAMLCPEKQEELEVRAFGKAVKQLEKWPEEVVIRVYKHLRERYG